MAHQQLQLFSCLVLSFDLIQVICFNNNIIIVEIKFCMSSREVEVKSSRKSSENKQKQTKEKADIQSNPVNFISIETDNSHQNHVRQKQQKQPFEKMTSDEIANLKLENKNLKSLNKQMTKQLEEFERRLDLKLQTKQQKDKRYKVGQQIVQSMQLKNAYKMCDIYKKQISFLKRKQEENQGYKAERLENIVGELIKQKQELALQIKDLKKTIKKQEKALKQLSGPNALKLLQQNQRLKENIRKMQMLYDGIQRQKNKYAEERERDRNFSVNGRFKKEKDLTTQNYSSNRQMNQIDDLKMKVNKGNKQLNKLLSDNQKYKQYNAQLKTQIVEKQKQLNEIREKMAELKKYHKSSRKKRVQTEPELPLYNAASPKNLPQSSYSRHRKLISDLPKISNQTQAKPKSYHKAKFQQIYPKLLEIGKTKQDSYKWNHHRLSSKIKQVKVCPHPSGHIKEVTFRYEKGDPVSSSKNKYARFCCDENQNEYVTVVRGGFKNQLLQYLFIQTNLGRKASFCDYYLEEQCENWEFKSEINQFLGAFFGQNTQAGVCRVGCFLQSKN